MDNYDFDLIIANLLDLCENVEDVDLKKMLKSNIMKLIDLSENEISQTHLDYLFESNGHIEKVENGQAHLLINVEDVDKDHLKDWLLQLK